MSSSIIRTIGIALALLLGAWATGCDECDTSRDCVTGEACIDGTCQAGEPFNPGSDSDSDTDTDADTDTDTEDPYAPEWIEIVGGTFAMGYAEGQDDELPVHDVDVPTFEITRSEITVIQYALCVNQQACGEPTIGARYNWQAEGRANHPVNGVTWSNAEEYCSFVGGRLPSEAEWEYAARSEGQDLKFPWGESDPTCEYCVMDGPNTSAGCGENRTWQVCSKPAGSTENGLCDMTGNVYEWMADYYYYDYYGAPTDGSAWDEPPYPEYADRTIRGCSFQCPQGITALRTSGRLGYDQGASETDLGFRCARDVD